MTMVTTVICRTGAGGGQANSEITDQGAGRRRRRLAAAAASLAAAGVALGSVAWACVPNHDNQVYIGSCTPPNGATKACKPMLNTRAFPEATVIKGPRGSQFWAYVTGGPMLNNTPYDLMFASATLLANGGACHNDPSVVIGGPTIAKNDGIPPTLGTIPADAPLGRGQVCFSDSPAHTGKTGEGHIVAANNLPAVFKVVI